MVWCAGSGGVEIRLDGEVVARSSIDHGSRLVTGLAPDTRYLVETMGGAHRQTHELRTLACPGPEVARIATLNDLHLGHGTFGVFDRITDPRLGADTGVHCAGAAIDAAVAWGAEAIVMKGDLTHHAAPHEWEILAALIDSCPVPVHLLPGNHEVFGNRRRTTDEWLERLDPGATDRVRSLDLGGLHVVLADVTIAGASGAAVEPVSERLVDAVADGRPALVLHHHQLQTGIAPTVYPVGAWGAGVRRLLDAVSAVNPNVMFSSGHTHRHRRHVRRGVTMSEVGSPKDYPGTWAGYTVHESGLTQTVYRVGTADTLAWTERTGRAVGGLWSRWSPGSLDDRCFTVHWTA